VDSGVPAKAHNPAEMALPPKTASTTVIIAIVSMLLPFIVSTSFIKFGVPTSIKFGVLTSSPVGS
jgi:hypothetical protein